MNMSSEKPQDEVEGISIATLNDGAAVLQINAALSEAWRNIHDINTPALEKRKIVLEVTLIPDEARELILVETKVTKKFASDKPAITRVLLGETGGQLLASELVSPSSKQTDFTFDRSNVTSIDAARNGERK
jgi:hypothetical protein